jgi:agmatine deiminase
MTQPPRRRRWPAEWAPHRATWLSWPHNPETWPGAGRLDAVEDAFCEMVRAIVPGERVEINVADAEMADRVGARLRGAGVASLDRVGLHLIPTDDAWVRDHGGLFVMQADASGREERLLLDFEFDAWGGKYPPWDHDADVATGMAAVTGVRREAIDGVVMEGGSIDGDGEGTILTTESCLLNPNRDRPGIDRSREALEQVLAERLGARRVLWLGDGIVGDDTDGHIDDLTRFVAPGRVVTVVEPNRDDVNHGPLAENRRRLETLRDAEGRRLEVVELPMPPPLEGPDGRLPASYANFYFANAALLVPVFGADADREALGILEALVPDRPVVPIPAQNLVLGLGAVHCLTQQEPELV